MKTHFYGKKVLVTGGTGLIGIPLVKKLVDSGALVRVVSLDSKSPFGKDTEFVKGDLCDKNFCAKVLKGIQTVFHLAGIKGGVRVTQSKASTFLVKNILMNTQIMEAARKSGVEQFLYVSSICIYPPAKIFFEENAGKGLPHFSDKFGGIAKLVGEMQIEAYRLQYGLRNFLIVRPVNTYGPYDNFDPVSALVIPALIYRIFDGENPLIIKGNADVVRDFVYSEDVADFLILMASKNVPGPYNVGSGVPVSIKSLVNKIVFYAENFLGKKVNVKWAYAAKAGEKYRVASIKKAKVELGWLPKVSLDEGILRTMEWYQANKKRLPRRYNILSEE